MKYDFFIKRLLIISFLFSVGCQGPVFRTESMQNPGKTILIDVSQVKIVLKEEAEDDHSQHLMDIPLASQVKHWFESRLKAEGQEGIGYLVIQAVHFKEEAIPQQKGLSSLLTKQATERYTCVIDVKFEIQDSMGFAKQFAAARVERSAHIFEGMTLGEKQEIAQRLTNTAIVDVDEELCKNIKLFFPLMIQE